MPEIDCKSCSRMCGPRCHAEFIKRWLFAWAKDEPLPECADYKERYWRGRVPV